MLSCMEYHWDNLSDIEMMEITEEIKRKKIKGVFSSKEQIEQVNALLFRARRDNISNIDIKIGRASCRERVCHYV